MSFFNRTQEEIVSASIDRVRANTNFSQLSPGSKVRFLLESTATESSKSYSLFGKNLMQPFISFADNRFLTYLGDMLNLPRLESSFSESDTEDFMFYVSSGTFGDINSGIDFVIPKGTLVSSVAFDETVITPGLEVQEVIEYTTSEDVTCSAAESFSNVKIRAKVEGSFSNVAKNVIRNHNFASYSLSSSKRLRCTNRYSISNGQDQESSESYRFRLSEVFKARELAIFASIRLAALSIPGVSNIKDVTCEQGTGSYSIYVKGQTPTVSPSLLQEVSSACYSVTAFGIRPFVLSPSYLGLDFVAMVNWASKATTEEFASGYISIRNSLENYLNRTEIGEGLFIEDLVNLLVRSAPLISNFGSRNSNTFENIYVYRRDPSALNLSIRNLFYGEKIEPLYNEQIILETSGRYKGIQFLTRQ